MLVAEPSVLDEVPRGEPVDWADVLGALCERGAPLAAHVLDEYWLDLDAPDRLRRGTST